MRVGRATFASDNIDLPFAFICLTIFHLATFTSGSKDCLGNNVCSSSELVINTWGFVKATEAGEFHQSSKTNKNSSLAKALIKTNPIVLVGDMNLLGINWQKRAVKPRIQ